MINSCCGMQLRTFHSRSWGGKEQGCRPRRCLITEWSTEARKNTSSNRFSSSSSSSWIWSRGVAMADDKRKLQKITPARASDLAHLPALGGCSPPLLSSLALCAGPLVGPSRSLPTLRSLSLHPFGLPLRCPCCCFPMPGVCGDTPWGPWIDGNLSICFQEMYVAAVAANTCLID